MKFGYLGWGRLLGRGMKESEKCRALLIATVEVEVGLKHLWSELLEYRPSGSRDLCDCEVSYWSTGLVALETCVIVE